MKHVDCAKTNASIRAQLGTATHMSGIDCCGTHVSLPQTDDEEIIRCQGIWIGYD